MGYLVCYDCDIYYEVTEEEAREIACCGECGSPLNYFERLEDSYSPKIRSNINFNQIKNQKTYTEKKKSFYFKIMGFGALLTVAGVLVQFSNFMFGIFLIFIGIILIIMGNSRGSSWIAGAYGEEIVSDYLQKLPDSFYIFNDVNPRGNWGNIDHVVVGPTGIFVIETKNYSTPYVVKGDDWYYNTPDGLKLADHKPGKQVKRNTMNLRELLIENQLIEDKVWINSVVALNGNVSIRGELYGYKIMKPYEIPHFILRHGIIFKKETVREISAAMNEISLQSF
ncbi:nuclease-related domain-containing protein [Methanobacterium aggregans]|uniref:nuclease-related domain-containing protein n=1 Tax=Methanobacterium aggregans TaxID=1615586 RepID=UPI001AE2E464|nr:nuclease-related domain-containing protein [Methanobacterium aggregans]MBP2045171.1 hypothetical protein [Methanobacterium aggregans]